jgi:hypothetical protein
MGGGRTGRRLSPAARIQRRPAGGVEAEEQREGRQGRGRD